MLNKFVFLGKIVIDGVENANYWQDHAQRQLTNPPSGDLDASVSQRLPIRTSLDLT
jgi:hypothetical protein